MNPDEQTPAATLSGAEAAVEMLKAYGVEFLFGLCGDTSLPFYDALARLPHGMRHILARDERSAAYMADGYARVSGKVGVCEGPSGGGVTYIVPGLAEANESSVPLLCINSDISVAARGRFTLTELDQGALMRPVTKWNAVLNRADDLPRVFRAAFRQCTGGRPETVKFSQTAQIPVAREPLWDFLMDVPKVAKSLPGVESVSKIDDTTYEGALVVRVGPIKLNLQGKIILEEQNKNDWRAALRAEAKDRMAAGAVSGKTSMTLKELAANQTELQVETDVNILGKIGEFGQPIIRKKADAMLKEFVDNIKKQLAGK